MQKKTAGKTPRKTRQFRNKSVKSHSKSVKSNSKSVKLSNEKKSHIVRIFIEMLNLIKLYHWKTRSYAQHKATDELYDKLNEHIDKFVEVLLGKSESRIHMVNGRIQLIDQNLKTVKSKVYEYRGFLVDLNQYFDSNLDSDLLNLRDEILADINQFLYLLTFDK